MDTALSRPVTFTISADDVPEEALSHESFAFLVNTYRELKAKLNEPLAETSDRTSAAVAALGRQALLLARRYLWRAMAFLMDMRFHPDAKIRLDARGIVKYEDLLPTDFRDLVAMSVSARQLLPSVPSAVANELRVLHLSADVFFELLETVFPLREIAKCRMGFSLVMQAIGTPAATGALANYERRHKTMYRAIANWRENGGTVTPAVTETAVKAIEAKIDEMRSSVEANTRAVANMDRRQKKFFTFLNPVQQKLAAIFHRKDKDPFAAVTVGEPRRSQLIAVIKYTFEHPIEHDSKTREAFTLAHAVRAVWLKNHAAWEKVPGGYETFDALKGACYGLQKKQNDPFRYR